MKDLLLCVHVVVTPQTLTLTFTFGTLRQRITLECVPQVQRDYFSSFNQSDLCFLTSSLPLRSFLGRLLNDIVEIIDQIQRKNIVRS